MGKKTRDDQKNPQGKGKRGIVPFSFLGRDFETDSSIVKQQVFYLILAVVFAKFLIAFFTTTVFHSFVDLFDIGYYLDMGLLLIQGQLPYVDFDFAYPILLLIPIIISLVPAVLFDNGMAFVFTFQALMILCDIVTVLCVYLICLRLWNERKAFLAGLLYTAMFSAGYFVITKYDSFPTCFLMIAILCTLYGHAVKGYAASITGFFIKVFPGIALPFLILFNAKKISLREEVFSAIKVGIPLFIVLFLPLFILSPGTLKIYIPVRSELGYYSNTLTFTLYSWLHDVLGLGISIDLVSAGMYLFMGAGILLLLFVAWKLPQRDAVLMLKLVLCAIVLVVICAKVRSPQYIVWFTPLLCILAVDDIRKIAALFVFQAFAYIEFPLMFGAYYTALAYTAPVLSGGWMVTLVMFSLMYLSLLSCVWLVVDPPRIVSSLRKAMQAPAA